MKQVYSVHPTLAVDKIMKAIVAWRDARKDCTFCDWQVIRDPNKTQIKNKIENSYNEDYWFNPFMETLNIHGSLAKVMICNKGEKVPIQSSFTKLFELQVWFDPITPVTQNVVPEIKTCSLLTVNYKNQVYALKTSRIGCPTFDKM